MDIDPRLREASSIAKVSDTPSHRDCDAYGPASTSYTLNPIRLPPPQQHSSGLPSLLQETGHSYYAIQHDPAAHSAFPRRQVTPSNDVHRVAVPPHIGSDRKDESKRPRACEACRGLKVRCVPDPLKGSCRRCAKAGRHCVVTLPTRKRQKKTDTRVAELERKIDALTASLQATKNQAGGESDGDSSDEEQEKEESAVYSRHNQDQRISSGKAPSSWPRGELPTPTSPKPLRLSIKRARYSPQDGQESSRPEKAAKTRTWENGSMLKVSTGAHLESNKAQSLSTSNIRASQAPLWDPVTPGHEYADVVDRKIIDAEAATRIFEHYRTNMSPHMPAVVFPPATTAGEVRRTKPTLFLAILSVASYHEFSKIQKTLLREITRVYAESIICKGEKSLELVQALQISTIWYAPEDYRDAKPYQLINMAVSMAIALGLSQKRKFFTGLSINGWRENIHSRSTAIEKGTIENYRAWLACYSLSGITAMGLKQDNMLSWSPYLDECVHSLETFTEAMPSDKILSLGSRLQRIRDDVVARFETDNEYPASQSHNSDSSKEIIQFRKRLDDWLIEKSDDVHSSSLTLAFSVFDMHLHQIDVRHRYNVEALDGTNGLADVTEPPIGSALPKTAELDAVKECLKSIHRVLDIFLSFSVEDVQTIPTFHFLRIAYAVVCLVRLHRAAMKSESEIGTAIPTASMDVEGYVTRLLTFMQLAAAEEKCRPAQNFQLALRMIMIWFKRQANRLIPQTRAEGRLQNFRLEARPVDTDQRTSGSGYRKISIPTDKSSGPTTPREVSKVRTPSITMPENPDEEQQPLASMSQPQGQSHQYHQYNCVPLQMGSTPLDLLSQVATSDASASAYQLPTTGNNEGWYNNSSNNINYSPQVASASAAPPLPYASWNEPYYQSQPGYPEVQSTTNVDSMYQDMTMDMGLEQAMGMTFGAEGDVFRMFMGDPFTSSMPMDYMTSASGW